MPDEKPAPRPARDPQALSAEYHKARKQLMLWSGILFIWELIGIDLEKAKEAGGNAGAIITAIKSPQAIPWVLLILVAYFLFKTTVEWYQCSAPRRALRVSRIDFGSVWITAALAYALYIYQRVRNVQFADAIQTRPAIAPSAAVGLAAGIALLVLILAKRERYRSGEKLFVRKDAIRLASFVFATALALKIVNELWGVFWTYFIIASVFVLLGAFGAALPDFVRSRKGAYG